jgi:hypothetical protein
MTQLGLFSKDSQSPVEDCGLRLGPRALSKIGWISLHQERLKAMKFRMAVMPNKKSVQMILTQQET